MMGEKPCFMSLFPPDQPLPSQQNPQQTMKKPVKSVVVVRHGERLDYTMRDRGENWIPTTDRPWDPPLTDNGRKIANALGVALPEILESLKLPPIGAVYSSPFHRCRQTASELCALNDNVKVRVEPALCESISENWFRSWASSGTDGSWGYGKKDYPDVNKLDPETLHPLSRQPVQPLLEWKQGVSDSFLEGKMDPDYVSKTSIDIPYSLYPANLENYDIQRKRMHDALNLLSDLHKDETIVLVSHGAPVTHLYESLTGNKWNVHGTAKYCCYSIYKQEEGDETWQPLVVNRVLGEDPKKDDSADKDAAFTWA